MGANLLRHPVPALIWECWRLSRRWYLWVLPAIIGIDLFFMSQGGNMVRTVPTAGGASRIVGYVAVAPSTFIVNLTIAIFTTLLAISVGGRSGFPMTFEYRLPLRTGLLVAVPMLTLATLCASLYFVPMLVCKLVFGIPFPLLSGSAMMATLVIILLASSWSTTSPTARNFTMLFAIFNSVQLFALLAPFNPQPLPRGPLSFNPDILTLTPFDYLALALIAIGLFAFTVTAIRKQRLGENVPQGLQRSAAAQQDLPPQAPSLFERASDLLGLACPVSAPWKAELWLELKRQGLPVMLISGLVALAVPLLFAIGITPDATSDRMDYLFPLSVFLAGIGIAIFNRRQASAGFMSAFEGTRGMTTTGLAMLQMLAIFASILCGMLLVGASVHLASGMLATPGAFARHLQALVASGGGNPLHAAAGLVMQLAVLMSVILLFACVHAWSVVWGRILPYGAGLVASYGLILAFRVQNGYADLEDLKQHMWGLALVIAALTLLALARTLYLRILSLRTGLVALLCWAAFVTCSVYSLAQQGIVVASQAPELRALNASLLLLPFTLILLLFWSYDRLRHR